MRKLTILFLLTVAVTTDAASLRVGASGAQFLKIGVGSRYQGIGEAAVATVNDAYSMYWNPAGLANVEGSAITFTNVNWLLDIKMNYLGYARNFEGIGVFGVSTTVLSMGDQEIRTFENQDGTGTYYSASSYAIALTFSRHMTTRFSFGGTVKYIGEKIHLERASGMAFDFGTMFYPGYKSLRLGMSITNMGPEMKFDGPNLDVPYDPQNGTGSNSSVGARLKSTPYNLPMAFRVGLAYDWQFGPKSILTLASELKHPNDNIEQGSLGGEFAYNDQFFLRAGYKINYNEESLALGGGLKTTVSGETRLLIDYSWQDFGRLESAQRFSVGFTF